jgi:hypothetical protein
MKGTMSVPAVLCTLPNFAHVAVIGIRGSLPRYCPCPGQQRARGSWGLEDAVAADTFSWQSKGVKNPGWCARQHRDRCILLIAIL